MIDFNHWCEEATEAVGGHALHVLTATEEGLGHGRDALAEAVPDHYAAEEHVARVLRRLGKPQAAAFIEGKLPTTKGIRSGDLGEILATEYVDGHTVYEVPIKRLRWKDHRNMAMRGDDLIGVATDPATGRLLFLKAEAKSRAALAAGVVTDARAALNKDGGLPSAHALSFISSRLLEAGNAELADAIDDAQLKLGIPAQSVKHLLFTFSGNNPANHLRTSLEGCVGPIVQQCVGVRVEQHAAFVGAVYDTVIANANND